jgi:hypothetical protein
VVWRSIWQFLDAILLAAWWLGIGAAPPPRSSPAILPVALLAVAAGAGGAAKVAGLNLVRAVLVGVLFLLLTTWWISLLVVFARESPAASATSPT